MPEPLREGDMAVTDRWVSGSGQRRLSHVSLVMAVVVAFLASAVGGGRAFAAPATVGGGCGFHLGVPFETGALGSFELRFGRLGGQLRQRGRQFLDRDSHPGLRGGPLPTPSGQGYWLLGGDGGIFTYGDAGFDGATPMQP